MEKKVIVIGGGIGGLAASALLAKEGFDVTVLEKNSTVGGRARIWEKDGFRFDMGPSWYLMPEVFEHFFALFGKKREDYYSLKRLDPAYRVFFEAGDGVDVFSDMEKAAALFESFENGGAEKLRRYVDQSRYKYEVAMRGFLYKNYTSVFDFFNRRMLIEGSRLNVFGSLDRMVSRLFKDRRARQLLEYAMVFLGTSPQKAPGLYSIMSHVDLNLGVFYPHGGLSAVAGSLQQLAESLGVKIHTGEPAERIVTSGGRAQAVVTSNETLSADLVVANADYAHVETRLLDDSARSKSASYWNRRVWAPSMFLLYLGLNRRLHKLTHHNLYFSENWNEHFDTIFKHPGWPQKPCFYVSCISKSDDNAAPADGENVFVLVPVAPGLQDTDEQRQSYADHVISHVEEVSGESIRSAIAVQRIYSQRDFIDDYNAYRGTALGLSHTLGQTAVFRPPPQSRRVKNLYYTGQYTHPGVGVPMVLISAQVAAGLIKEAAA